MLGMGPKCVSHTVEGDEGYMWEQPLVDSVDIFERISKLPFREMLSRDEKEELLPQVPMELWTTFPNEFGRIKDAEPVHIMVDKAKLLPRIKQYPIRKEARKGIAPVIAALLEQGVIRETVSRGAI